MVISFNKKCTCCFTGHRPQKLPWGFDEKSEKCIRLKTMLVNEIETMHKKGVDMFISGMAMGVDMWAAEIVIDMKRTYPNNSIKLISAIPFEGQAIRWDIEYRERYRRILSKADEVVILQKGYTKNCLNVRNQFMVDNSAHMIAVFNGNAGGTANTLRYAISKGIDTVIIDINGL